MLGKLQTLYGMAQNPGSSFDLQKIEEEMVEFLDFPFDPQGLKKDALSGMMQLLTQAVSGGIGGQPIDPQQLLQAAMKTLEDMKKPPQRPLSETLSLDKLYGEGPPSIQAQIEIQAGFVPAPDHEREGYSAHGTPDPQQGPEGPVSKPAMAGSGATNGKA
jgi:hypothetical protein